MAIRIDLSQDQDVEVTATFEVSDEVPDGVTADDAEDILELMDNSNISMEEVIEEALLAGVDVPNTSNPTFDIVLAFVRGDNVEEAWQLTQLIEAAAHMLRRHVHRVEEANKSLLETIDRVSEPDQKTA